MGEAVVSGDAVMAEETEVVRWERVLPRMMLNVLLVEADDSTRQIITALLRKCGYRVAAVSDGLMAWETLKGGPNNIDLILTEVELPSISGYALLTLVMEDDICKNIPVIMMSSKDSISMVLKCMLKGAADFLIKPVRRNELRNLWRHVWRRQTTAGHIPQSSPVAQHKVEGTSENNTASNHSSDRVNSSPKDKECSDKGSDAESSSTIGYLDAESAHMPNMQGLSQPKFRRMSNLSNTDQEKSEDIVNSDMKLIRPPSEESLKRLRADSMPSGEAQHEISLRIREEHAKSAIQDKNARPENDRENGCIPSRGNNELDEPPNGAIDLIGAFDSSNSNYGNAIYEGTKKSEFNPQLELSLQRSYPTGSRNHGVDERHTLNHSNASAFSRYNNRGLQPFLPTSTIKQPFLPTSTSKQVDCKDDVYISPELSSNQISQNTDAIAQQHGVALHGSQEILTTLAIGQSGQAEITRPSPQHGSISFSGLKFDKISSGYSHANSPASYSQSGLNPVWTSKLAGQREQSPFSGSLSAHSNNEMHESEQKHRGSDETTNNYVDQKVQQQNNKELLEEQRYGSPATGQSSSSSLCNGVMNNNTGGYGSFGSGSDTPGTVSTVTEKNSVPENVQDGSLVIHDGLNGMDSHRSSQREAALTKFRLKRKERCYEKKVRYQSRKRLAEQRPRVKGQFVRQAQSDAPVSAANS